MDKVKQALAGFEWSRPGRRAAALSALWIAATGRSADAKGIGCSEEALAVYRLVPSEQRAATRTAIDRAIDCEPHRETRETMIRMRDALLLLEERAVAPVRRRLPDRRRRELR